MKKKGLIILGFLVLAGLLGCWVFACDNTSSSIYLHSQEVAEVETNGVKALIVGHTVRNLPPGTKIKMIQSIFLWFEKGLEVAIPLDEQRAVVFRVDPHILMTDGKKYSMFMKFGGLEPWLKEVEKVFKEGAEKVLREKISPTQIPGNLAFVLPLEYRERIEALGCHFHPSEHPEIVSYRIKTRK